MKRDCIIVEESISVSLWKGKKNGFIAKFPDIVFSNIRCFLPDFLWGDIT